MRSKDIMELIGGAGLGAGVMYLFDPQKGYERRHQLADMGRQYMSSTRDYSGRAYECARGTSKSLAYGASEGTSNLIEGIRNTGLRAWDGLRNLGKSISSGSSELVDRISHNRATAAAAGSAGWLGKKASDIGHYVSDTGRQTMGWFRRPRYTGFMPRTSTNQALTLVGAIGVAAGTMYLMDPIAGRRRRALIRDKFMSFVNSLGTTIDRTWRDLSNRARGVYSEGLSVMHREHLTDHQLMERVRSHLGRIVSSSRLVNVSVSDGRVFLSGGPIPVKEADELIAHISTMRGVKSIENLLTVEGGGQKRFMRSVRGTWSPTTRVASSVVGGVLATWGILRNDVLGWSLAAIGAGLVARGASNVSVRRLSRQATGRSKVHEPTVALSAEAEVMSASGPVTPQ